MLQTELVAQSLSSISAFVAVLGVWIKKASDASTQLDQALKKVVDAYEEGIAKDAGVLDAARAECGGDGRGDGFVEPRGRARRACSSRSRPRQRDAAGASRQAREQQDREPRLQQGAHDRARSRARISSD